jgi:hypothetical protein
MLSLQRFDQCRSAHAVNDAYAEGAMLAQHALSTTQTANAPGASALNTQAWLLQHWKNRGERDENYTYGIDGG